MTQVLNQLFDFIFYKCHQSIEEYIVVLYCLD